MDESVRAALARWPNVPSVYGWLSLDRRGNWLIKGERIGNPAVPEFIARNYECDERGRWFFQNGPQRVFVTLAYLPFVLRTVDAARPIPVWPSSTSPAPGSTIAADWCCAGQAEWGRSTTAILPLWRSVSPMRAAIRCRTWPSRGRSIPQRA
jgi:hypothetical protein